MTKEEAVKILKRTKDNSYCECDIGVALDMAIEALQAEYEDYEHATLVDIKEPLKVSVVRCKDCRHLYNKDFCSFFGSPTDAMDYCSHGEMWTNGERREE